MALCACGCGGEVRRGKTFIHGHNQRGRYPLRRVTPVEDRFWANVRKADGCWLWGGTITSHGYGSFGLGRKSDGKEGAHRFSWVLHHGPIPEGLWVLHRCDNKPCVNPDHLFLGTVRDNARDMAIKERARTTKLTAGEVCTLRRLYAAKQATQVQLATRFGIDQTTVSNIVRGNSWRHLL